MVGKALFFTLALSLSGCALRSMESHGLQVADGLSGSYPADADRLAREVADELSRRYAPARTGLALLVLPGQFGESLEQGLRAKGFAVSTAPEASGVRIGTVADVLSDELTPSGFVAVSTSDGQRFSLVRRLKGELVNSGETIVEAPFSMSEPAALVQTTALNESPAGVASVPAAGPSVSTPKEEKPSPLPVSRPTGTVLLPKAVLTVLPYNWRYTIPDADRRQVKVGTPKNIPWREAMQHVADEAGCEARFDDVAHRVTLVAVKPVPVPVAPVAMQPAPIQIAVQPAPAQPVSALHPASLPEPAVAPATPPAVPASVPSEPVVAQLTASPATLPEAVQPVEIQSEAQPVEETWALESGSLYAQLGRWADQAGYQLVWKAGTDLTMESAAVFRGAFMDAVRQLFAGLTRTGHGLRVTFYSNNVMEVRSE